MDPLDEVCACGHERRAHYGHGRPGTYDPCLAKHQGLDGTVCPCMAFVKAAEQP